MQIESLKLREDIRVFDENLEKIAREALDELPIRLRGGGSVEDPFLMDVTISLTRKDPPVAVRLRPVQSAEYLGLENLSPDKYELNFYTGYYTCLRIHDKKRKVIFFLENSCSQIGRKEETTDTRG
ncbi:hypothetical protein FJZ19_00405 [Candidatus Pacearchaeota archaeon]|nr:hypothetical protein [Candidatus Pacearchaeota archaeon]